MNSNVRTPIFYPLPAVNKATENNNVYVNTAVYLMRSVAFAISVSLVLTACGGSDHSSSKDTAIAKPAMPVGVGFEQTADVGSISYPYPAVENVPLNSDNGRFFRDENPILLAQSGINRIWKGTTEQWQTTAGSYTREANLYKAGDGPNPHNAANGQPSDYVEEGTEIIDAAAWAANIRYVADVTAARTDSQTYFAFLDDIRSKNYSVIDGFGPLTEDYAENSGAYAQFEPILLSDVTDNDRYAQPNNDSFSTYGGKTDSTLGDMVQLASRFRNSAASTSGPKYVYGTPRPWRMNNDGKIIFLGVDTLNCVDGASANREVKTYRIDRYISNVTVIPGLNCGRRAHSSGNEDKLFYTATTENRRKDNGYPSGHTNAGYLASFAYAYAMPERYAEILFRASDLGENRILAGMHSPLDIIGARIQATMISAYALTAFPEEAAAAYDQANNYFGAKAVDAGMSLYEYAHQPVTSEKGFENSDRTLNVNVFNNSWYGDRQAIKAEFTFRLTYGLPQNGTLGLAPVVPLGAEVLLASRFPYLSADQRRAVLATTEVESGYPVLDESNGWGRLNLLAAADGYAAFDGDVAVTMNANEGRFNAQDWWRNNISGAGKLTKSGTGHLVLSGENTYGGGTVVEGGTLEATSASAFGVGDLYLNGGTAFVNAEGALHIATNVTVNENATLKLGVDGDSAQIDVAKVFYIDGGKLVLDFSSSAPVAGSRFTLINADVVSGEFSSVDAGSYSVTLEYTGNSLVAQLK